MKSDGSELLKSLFKKERMSKEQSEHFTLGHKKGEKLSKTYEKYEQFALITSKSLTSLFFKECHAIAIPSCPCFVQNNMSESLTVALL